MGLDFGMSKTLALEMVLSQCEANKEGERSAVFEEENCLEAETDREDA